MAAWETLSSKVVFDHPRLSLAEDKVLLPDGKEIDYLRFEGYEDSILVIAEDKGKILMVREYAYPIKQVLLQFPEGGVHGGEDILEAGGRELAEESTYQATELSIIGYNLTHHRRTTAKNHVALASGLSTAKDIAGDPEEIGIEPVWLTETEINQKIAVGEIIQKNTLAAWAIYQARKATQD